MPMRRTIGSFLAQRRTWEKLMQATSRLRPAATPDNLSASRLREIQAFGSNPGALRMFSYLPRRYSGEGAALVVVLHGCTQTAASYDLGAGWSTLADRYGFALLLPEQPRCNNPNGCFNWFQPGDIKRDHGEALSIRQMIDKMASEYRIDQSRVFVTGLSAGGAMTSVLLAAYPDVFAGGAIIAGLPYGAASNVQQAFESMFQCPARPARAWGDLVRGASSHGGPWPRISVWHGGADKIVIPSNAGEIVKQWTDVHGLPGAPTVKETVDGYPRQVWCNAAGEELIEAYTIPRMAHGAPLAVGEADNQCGTAGAFLLDVSISSSYHIAKFWGLADHTRARAELVLPSDASASTSSGGLHAMTAAENTEKEAHDGGYVPAGVAPAAPMDIGAVIANALKAAGLMKAT